jgi:hypothetical protein
MHCTAEESSAMDQQQAVGSNTAGWASEPPREDFGSDGRAVKRAGALPALVRRAVMLRDHGRCRFPGCCRRRYVDVFPLISRSGCAQSASRADGGECSRNNSLVLCAAHHRLLQGGKLDISGDAEGELTFSHPQSRIRFGTVSGAVPPQLDE